MLYILVPVVILLALVKWKSNRVFFVTLMLMWILLGWSSGNADYSIHLGRFNNYEQNSGFTEILYTALMRFANGLGFTYPQFLPVMTLWVILVIGLLAKKSKAPAFVLALYMMFPICMDAVQVRYTFAGSVVLLGLYYLINEKSKYGEIVFASCIILATLLHISSIVFLLFLPVKRFDIRKTAIYTLSISAVLYLSQARFMIGILRKLPGMGEKISRVLSMSATRYTWITILKTDFRVIVFFLQFIIIILYVRKRLRKRNNNEGKNFIENVIKLNIMSLGILPLITYSVDFYRIQQTLSLLNYCSLSYFFLTIGNQSQREKFMISKKVLMFDAICLLMTFVNLYLLVLNSSNIDTVFRPFLEKNLFFGG